MTDDLGEFPSPRTVADQLGCGRESCVSPGRCWTKGGCARTFHDDVEPDPKGHKRLRDSSAIKRKVMRERECRVPDCGSVASDGHHLLYRSLGGDDDEDNIIPICHVHHMVLEFDASDDRVWVRTEIGLTLSDKEVSYIMGRLGVVAGQSFLERDYYVDADSIRLRLSELLHKP